MGRTVASSGGREWRGGPYSLPWASPTSAPHPRPMATPGRRPTTSSSTTGRTRRCCGPRVRRGCACSSRPPRDGLEPARAGARPTTSTSGALLYACRRLPADVYTARRVVLGQEAVQFSRAGMRIIEWEAARGAREAAPVVRRRRRARSRSCSRAARTSTTSSRRSSPTRSSGTSCTRLLIGSRRRRRRRRRGDVRRATLGGTEDDWERLLDAWRLGATLAEVRDAPSTCASGCSAARRSATRGSRDAGGRRCARCSPIVGCRRPPAVPRLLEHPLAGEPPQRRRAHARGRGRPLDRARGPADLRDELERFREGRHARLVGELPLLRAREAHPRTAGRAAPQARARLGVTPLSRARPRSA